VVASSNGLALHGVMPSCTTSPSNLKEKSLKSLNSYVQDIVKACLPKPKLIKIDGTSKSEEYMDSTYIKEWLPKSDADEIYNHLKIVGEKIRPADIAAAAAKRSKYPLWTKYYGLQRNLDKARALDRWGSYHESWVRVEEPPDVLKKYASRLRKQFNLNDDCINSMVVNYYFDGENTYIPAHRDTTACLEDGSQVMCLSLGASRDFVLCSNDDLGGFEKSSLSVAREWRVGHGDLFALGPATNERLLHAVTREPGGTGMRVSVIFRSITKSYIDTDAPAKEALYSNGSTRVFNAECITALHSGDIGTREHLADLISERERAKTLAKESKSADQFELELQAKNLVARVEQIEGRRESECKGDESGVLRAYYNGHGCAVPRD